MPLPAWRGPACAQGNELARRAQICRGTDEFDAFWLAVYHWRNPGGGDAWRGLARTLRNGEIETPGECGSDRILAQSDVRRPGRLEPVLLFRQYTAVRRIDAPARCFRPGRGFGFRCDERSRERGATSRHRVHRRCQLEGARRRQVARRAAADHSRGGDRAIAYGQHPTRFISPLRGGRPAERSERWSGGSISTREIVAANTTRLASLPDHPFQGRH